MSEINIKIKDYKFVDGEETIDGFIVTAGFDEDGDPYSYYEYGEFHTEFGKINLGRFLDRALMRFQEASGQVKPHHRR